MNHTRAIDACYLLACMLPHDTLAIARMFADSRSHVCRVPRHARYRSHTRMYASYLAMLATARTARSRLANSPQFVTLVADNRAPFTAASALTMTVCWSGTLSLV